MTPSTLRSIDAKKDSAAPDAVLRELTFAVVDVETTGLDPAHDEILEIAIVRVSGRGRIEDEFETLVRAARPTGGQHVHGISSADLAGAPTLSRVAPAVQDRLCDAVVVGHNVAFDLAFLAAAWARMDLVLPTLPQLCTLDLARLIGREEGCHRLERACRDQGIALAPAHRAGPDARATAALLLAHLADAEALERRTLRDLWDPSVGCCATWATPVLPRR